MQKIAATNWWLFIKLPQIDKIRQLWERFAFQLKKNQNNDSSLPNDHNQIKKRAKIPKHPRHSLDQVQSSECRRDHLLLLLTTLHYGSLARPCLPHFQLQNQNRASPVPASLDAAAAGHWHCIPLSYALALFFDSVFNNMISGVWCDVDVVEFSYYGAPTPTPKEQLYTELVDGLRGSDSCIGFGSQVLLP
ncbi:hypothetical protein HN51_036908 [Arachis hypogaea]